MTSSTASAPNRARASSVETVGAMMTFWPSRQSAGARERFGVDAVDEVKPYLRVTTAPA